MVVHKIDGIKCLYVIKKTLAKHNEKLKRSIRIQRTLSKIKNKIKNKLKFKLKCN